ncbi:MAG: ketopantoate reductase family protein [Acidobacteriia bacterium]|nr:ketopantoate reductase family protein [Terriglobia bacterium]
MAAHPLKLQLESAFGNWSVEVGWASSVPPTDVLWLTVKAPQLDAALRSITDASTIAAIVPLLNGVEHVELLRSKYGPDHVIPATIAGEFERASIGHIIHRTPFARLNLSSRGRGLLQTTLDQLQGMGFTCNFVDDEVTLMWSKLVFLAPLALTTTAFDRTIDELVAGPETWEQLQAGVREACAAGQAEGARVEAGPVLEMIKGLPRGMRSSMQKDVEHGRPPELDAIGGPIVRGAKRHGLKAPVTEALMAQIERAGQASRRAS